MEASEVAHINQFETEPETELPNEPVKVPVRTVVRGAKISDIPRLIEMMAEFAEIQKRFGNQIYAKEPNALRGGICIELSLAFNNPRWKILVAQRHDELIGYMMASLEDCGPTEDFLSCVRIRGDYVTLNSLAKPRILEKMWDEVKKWGSKNGAGYFFGFIHPGNAPSIRTAKKAGFKHYMTMFLHMKDEEE